MLPMHRKCLKIEAPKVKDDISTAGTILPAGR